MMTISGVCALEQKVSHLIITLYNLNISQFCLTGLLFTIQRYNTAVSVKLQTGKFVEH